MTNSTLARKGYTQLRSDAGFSDRPVGLPHDRGAAGRPARDAGQRSHPRQAIEDDLVVLVRGEPSLDQELREEIRLEDAGIRFGRSGDVEVGAERTRCPVRAGNPVTVSEQHVRPAGTPSASTSG